MADQVYRTIEQVSLTTEEPWRTAHLNRILKNIQLRLDEREGRLGETTVLGDQVIAGWQRFDPVDPTIAVDLTQAGTLYYQRNEFWAHEWDQAGGLFRRMRLIPRVLDSGTAVGKASNWNFTTNLDVTLNRTTDYLTFAVADPLTISEITHPTEITIDTPSTVFTGDITYEDTFWDDLRVSAISIKVGASTWQPTWTQFATDGASSRGVYAWVMSASVANEVFFEVQLPHSYKEGTAIYPHVHWASDGTDTGNVAFQLEYVWQNVNGTFGNTTTIEVTDAGSGTANTHLLAAFPAIAGTSKTISSVLLCRLQRDPADGDDTLTDGAYLLSIDFHHEIDAPGSDAEYVK